MKKLIGLFLVYVVVLTACKNGNGKEAYKPKEFPKPGTVVARQEIPVTEDKLNNFKFTVQVVADSAITSGAYDVVVDYEYHHAEGHFSMPKGLENIKPVVRKGAEPYSCLIGFKVAGDTTFYDYFQVVATNKEISMKYIKAYTFQ